ncbi:MAG: RNA polymerase sigma factor [Bacteroidales bacterium]|nr:RNA polymerase sigma factor [Bacteroidales bacterium]
MMQPNDIELINQVLAGNVREFARLVDRYKNLAYTLAFRVLNNREDAEEVMQDAFVKAYRSLKDFRKESKFSTWLFRIVYNTGVSKKRLKKYDNQSIDDLSVSKEIALSREPDNELLEDRKALLEKAMQMLAEDDRVLITLYYAEECTVEEINKVTGLSRSNIKVRLFRARKKLHEWMAPATEKTCV